MEKYNVTGMSCAACSARVEKAVSELVPYGIISGYPDGTFKPGKHITRAEFAKIACTAYGIDANEYLVDEKDHYSDVNRYEWYAKYVKALTDKGIVSGDGNGTFRPNDKITREEAMTILTNISNNKDNNLDKLKHFKHISWY